MRLIDADAIEDVATAFNERAQKENGIPLTRYEFKRLSNVIFEFPTIDPVKHGKWIKDDVGVHCSECFCGWDFLTGIPVEVYGFHYCPNCGAKMDGGEE